MFYNFKANYLVRKVLFFNFPEILDKYYQYCQGKLSDNEFSAFKSNDGTIDIYYKNFHVTIINNKKDKIVSINLKREEDCWIINKDDYSNPLTKSFEIYRWYDVTVYDDDRHFGVRYVDGTWDKYFYKTLKELDKCVNDMTDKSQMYQEYAKVKV